MNEVLASEDVTHLESGFRERIFQIGGIHGVYAQKYKRALHPGAVHRDMGNVGLQLLSDPSQAAHHSWLVISLNDQALAPR